MTAYEREAKLYAIASLQAFRHVWGVRGRADLVAQFTTRIAMLRAELGLPAEESEGSQRDAVVGAALGNGRI